MHGSICRTRAGDALIAINSVREVRSPAMAGDEILWRKASGPAAAKKIRGLGSLVRQHCSRKAPHISPQLASCAQIK